MTAPSTPCLRCGHKLSAPSSIDRRYSLRCWRLELADRKREACENALRIAAAPFSARQIDDANALIAAGSYKRLSRPGLWAVTSSDGRTVYTVTALGCTCPSRKPCKHMCLAALIETYEAVA